MSYNQVIKNCINEFSQNELIFASQLYKEKLSNSVSETSFYKTLERMCLKNELSKISKGIYYLPKRSRYGIVALSENDIITPFLEKNKGIVIGYNLYNRLNLTTQISKKTVILSSKIDGATKNIRNIEIKNVQLNFNKEIRKSIEIFEVLENMSSIQDFSYRSLLKYIDDYVKEYNEHAVKEVIKIVKYKKSTISFLNEILNYHNIDNSLNEYLSSLSNYKHLKMEEIYELARTSK